MLEAIETSAPILATRMHEAAKARSRRLEKQLTSGQQHRAERVEAAEMLIQQLVAERDESRSQLNEVDDRIQQLEKEFIAAQEQFRKQRELVVQAIGHIPAKGADPL